MAITGISMCTVYIRAMAIGTYVFKLAIGTFSFKESDSLVTCDVNVLYGISSKRYCVDVGSQHEA